MCKENLQATSHKIEAILYPGVTVSGGKSFFHTRMGVFVR